ncbi:MAG: hypothetical protein HZC40_15760 [Chloroflexi bacterium]|nr:hypothetical protein [Chloroflexota bacterium]
MQNSYTLRHFSLDAMTLTLIITLALALVFVIGAQVSAQPATPMPGTNTTAPDLPVMAPELERENLDRPNTIPPSTHWESAPTFFESSVHGHEVHPSME